MQPDRHGRAARAVPDRRRRPSDGYRSLSARRFVELVGDVVATLPDPLAGALLSATVAVREIPPAETRPVGGFLPLVRVTGSRGVATSIVVYRRPVELRATSRLDMAELIADSIAREAAEVLGLDLGEDWGEH